MSTKYVTCIKCAYAMVWVQHEHLICSMDCPSCGAKEQFGPGVYIPEFDGYTMEEVLRQWASKTRSTGDTPMNPPYPCTPMDPTDEQYWRSQQAPTRRNDE